MRIWEAFGVAAAVIVTLGAVTGTLRDLARLPRQLWRVFGWHGAFWKFLVRVVQTVDVILSIPARLDRNEQLLADHIKQSRPQVALLNTIAERVDLLPAVKAMTEEVVGQVKSNGGSSLLDSNHRIETALGLPAPAKNRPNTAPTPTVPAPRRTKPSQESA